MIALLACTEALGQESITPGNMARLGEIDALFQSYNVEMVEVTGGRFWRPYPSRPSSGLDQDIYAYRPPVDLSDPRLRRLASALAPAYVRVSGTWANATYFADSEDAVSDPPAGYNSVLTRAQWRGLVNFAHEVDAQIVTSFAVSAGTRDRKGVWTPDQARSILAYTRSLGGHIAAAEYMNEPTLAAQNGAPPGYDTAAYIRDFRIFRELMKKGFPETLIVGPGSIGESASRPPSDISSLDLLAASGTDIEVFSYHHYGTISPRCGGRDMPEQALSEEWLSRTDRTLAFYQALRDRFSPRAPIWLTETADAACGGNPWDATFLDTFRYLDQLGRLAKAGVQVVMHNTLSGSDYGLLDERTFKPRPSYWAALLWHRLMGSTVLDPGLSIQPGFHVYAHCDPAKTGGVSVLAINTSRERPRAVILPLPSERYTLRATRLQSTTVQLNGKMLALGADDALPRLAAIPTPAGMVALEPATITFLKIPSAANPACH